MSSLQIDPMTQVPVDAELANLHLRLSGDDDLQLISHQLYVLAGAEYVEGQTRRTLASRSHVWTIPRFPLSNFQMRLPRGKTTRIDRIEYYESNSTTPVVLTGPSSPTPGTDYQEDLSSDNGARIRPRDGHSWPTVDHDRISPVKIYFTAGYTAPAEVPKELQVAVLVYAAQQLENPDGMTDLDHQTADRLLSPYKLDMI